MSGIYLRIEGTQAGERGFNLKIKFSEVQFSHKRWHISLSPSVTAGINQTLGLDNWILGKWDNKNLPHWQQGLSWGGFPASKKSQPGGFHLHGPPSHGGNCCIELHEHPRFSQGLWRRWRMQRLRDPCAGIVPGVRSTPMMMECARSLWAQAPPALSVTLLNIPS